MSSISDETIRSEQSGEKTGRTDRDSKLVEHHEIGEMARFLRTFGRNKEEVVKNLMASSLQIVGLEDVKKEYGDRWEKIEHRVEQAIFTFFTKKLRKKDQFVSLGKGRFVLIFANMSREEGQERAVQMSRELINMLFGEMPGIELISVEAMVLDVDVLQNIDEFDNLGDAVEYFQTAIEEAELREEEAVKEVKEEFTLQFSSILNHPKQRISGMELKPARRIGDVVSALPEDDKMLKGSPKLRSELDNLILTEAAEIMSELGARQNKPIVIVSISFETLANAYCRKHYAEQLSEIPEYTRRHLVLNVEGVGNGIPNSRYRQMLTPFNAYILGFALEFEKGWNSFEEISDLPVLALSASSNEIEDVQWIQPVFMQAKEAGLKCFWRDVKSDPLARHAFKIGVDYVSGPAISALQNMPIRPFSLV